MGKKTAGWVGFDDWHIYDDEAKIGTLRVKASGILWKPRGKHSWLKVSIDEFATYAEANGKTVKK